MAYTAPTTFFDSNTDAFTSSTTWDVSVTASSGQLVVVLFSAANVTRTFSVTDSASSTYTKVVDTQNSVPVASGTHDMILAYKILTSDITYVRFSASSTTPADTWALIYVFSNPPASPYDISNCEYQGNATSHTLTLGTTAENEEFVVLWLNGSASSSWPTAIQDGDFVVDYSSTGYVAGHVASQAQATRTFTAETADLESCQYMVAAFKAPASATSAVPRRLALLGTG